MLGMIFNQPFISFKSLWVIFKKEIEISHLDISFSKKMTFGILANHFVHFLDGFIPSSILYEEKSNTKLRLLGPLTVRVKTDEFSVGFHCLLFHSLFLVGVP